MRCRLRRARRTRCNAPTRCRRCAMRISPGTACAARACRRRRMPEFRAPEFLRAHIARTMAFYHPRCIDPAGGFFHYFKDDGSIYDTRHRHLVSSTRFVFDYAMAYREFGNPEYRDALEHGLRYLREVHRDPVGGGYAWTLRDGHAEDTTNHCY